MGSARYKLDFSRWNLAARAADPRLRGLLDRELVGFQQSGSSRWVERAVPAVTLMIGLGGALRADGARLPQAWVSGLNDSHAAVEIAGGYASLDIKLTPLGSYTMLGRPLSELARSVVPVEDVFGAAGDALAERMHDATGWGSRFDAVEQFLLERSAQGPAPSPVVEWAWERLCASAGRLRIEALARDLGCSRGYLAARFREQIGLAPKAAARLLRFHHVCTRIERDPGRWADLAYEAGYFDQSHLNRDFRDLAGMTPGEFLARVPPPGARPADERDGGEMRFVQD